MVRFSAGAALMAMGLLAISCSSDSGSSGPTATIGSEVAGATKTTTPFALLTPGSTVQGSIATTSTTSTSVAPAETVPPLQPADLACTIRPIEPADGFSSFYGKGCTVAGFWILANDVVDDEAITVAAELVASFFEHDPKVATALASTEVRLGILGRDQVITDMPEFSDLDESFPETNWDDDIRGLGAEPSRPLVAAGEENVLCDVGHRQLGEDILLHEFAHSLDQFVYRALEPEFGPALDQAYAQAMARGAWVDTYSTTDEREYWAEAVQAYFGRSLSAEPATGIYGPVDTPSEVKAEDPTLFDLIDKRLGGLSLPPSCHDAYADR